MIILFLFIHSFFKKLNGILEREERERGEKERKKKREKVSEKIDRNKKEMKGNGIELEDLLGRKLKLKSSIT